MDRLKNNRNKIWLGVVGTGLVACAALFFISRREAKKKAPVAPGKK